VVSAGPPFYQPPMPRLPATKPAALAIAVLMAATACRDKRATEGGTTAPSSPSSAGSTIEAGAPSQLRGWYVVDEGQTEASGPTSRGAGWWFSTDAVRMVWPTGRDRRVITSTRLDGDVLHLVVDDASYDVTRTASGLLLKIAGSGAPLRLRMATDDELRAMEKLDAQLIAKSGDACARAFACCRAARDRKLAAEADCTAIATTPELSRCVRTLERLRATATDAGQSVPECTEAP
jgi:hypothetical protein